MSRSHGIQHHPDLFQSTAATPQIPVSCMLCDGTGCVVLWGCALTKNKVSQKWVVEIPLQPYCSFSMGDTAADLQIGQRPSRRRRHLPMAVDMLPGSARGSARRTDVKHFPLLRMAFRTTSDDSDHAENDPAYGASGPQGRSTGCRPRDASTLVSRKTKGREHGRSRSAVNKAQQGVYRAMPAITRPATLRRLFWLGCIVWVIFLGVRILSSFYQGDYGQLSITHFLTRVWNEMNTSRVLSKGDAAGDQASRSRRI